MVEELKQWLLSSNLIQEKFGLKEKDFNTDFLDYKKNISLQIEPGRIVNAYIGGDKEIEQPFRLFYRVMNADNKRRNTIITDLNMIGEWVNTQKEMPSLGENIKVSKIECSSTASILEMDEKSTTYQIQFNINYEITKG